ncbi:MAG: hypothetical protein AAF532_16410 [Planctomycetota bacterium]
MKRTELKNRGAGLSRKTPLRSRPKLMKRDVSYTKWWAETKNCEAAAALYARVAAYRSFMPNLPAIVSAKLDPHHVFGRNRGLGDDPRVVLKVCRLAHKFIESRHKSGLCFCVWRLYKLGRYDPDFADRYAGRSVLGTLENYVASADGTVAQWGKDCAREVLEAYGVRL